MRNADELSGNIKLRLPKSLHEALLRQADYENVSLNQLCLMYLSAGVSKNNNLGTYEFNHRLEVIANESKNEAEMFQRLKELADEVERLKPYLLHELEGALNKNKRLLGDFYEVLRAIYPIYQGAIVGEKLPMLKLPSAKIVIRPKKNETLDFKRIEGIVTDLCSKAVVSYGDFDTFLIREWPKVDESYIKSISVHFYCDFSDLEKTVYAIENKLQDEECSDKMVISVKPSYIHIATRILLEQKNKVIQDQE